VRQKVPDQRHDQTIVVNHQGKKHRHPEFTAAAVGAPERNKCSEGGAREEFWDNEEPYRQNEIRVQEIKRNNPKTR